MNRIDLASYRHRLTALFVLLLLSLVGNSEAEPSQRVISSSATRLVFEIDMTGYTLTPSVAHSGSERLAIPGFGSQSGIGEPLVPARSFLVALPPNATYTVRHTLVRVEPLGSHRLEPVPYPVAVREGEFVTTDQQYRLDVPTYNAKKFTAGVTDIGESMLRNQRVLTLRVHPVTYDPTSGETSIATTIRIEVSFREPSRSGGAFGQSTRPVQEKGTWERIYGRVLVNPEQARQWRVKPRRNPQSLGTANESLRMTMAPLVKLRVRETAIHKVSAASVTSGGFPSGTPIGSLHLFKRSYNDNTMAPEIIDVPFKVAEGATGNAGTFDGDDDLIFYGQDIRDDVLQGDPIAKFSDHNLYWLGNTAGAQMQQKNVDIGFLTPDTQAASFFASRRFERDLIFLEATPPNVIDFYYYHFPKIATYPAPFSIGALAPGGTFFVRALLLGGDRARTRTIDFEIQNSNGTTAIGSQFVLFVNETQFTSAQLDNSILVEGLNTLRIRPNPGNQVNMLLEAALNWFKVDYQAAYHATGNVLDFDSGTLLGDSTLSVTGFDQPDAMLFDITDPLAPQDCPLSSGHFTDQGGDFALSFRDNFAQKRSYVAASIDGMTEIPAGDVIADVPVSFIGHPLENGVDLLVISNEEFMGEVQRLVDWRRAQGYRVLLADVDEIFDEFSGGLRHPRGIKRFVRRFFDMGNASTVLIVGDGSEDNKKVHNDSGENFVPTESFTEFVGAGFNEDEVVTSDKWYVMLDNDFVGDIPNTSVNPTDYIPDLIIGRIPAGSVGEARRVIDKILKYEQPRADEFWRRRMIRVSDNAWSGAFEFCLVPAEREFERAEERAATTIEQSLPGGYDVVRFHLSEKIFEDPSGCRGGTAMITDTRSNATPALLAEMNKGATWVSWQTHMNRHRVCHEWLFASEQFGPTGPGIQDHLKTSNTDKPYILFGLGCHLSDFALHKERSPTNQRLNGQNGDCISELLLLQDRKGAIATYGSTGFEYLNTNSTLTNVLTATIYETPPVDAIIPSGKAQARWILGELMTISEIENLNVQGNPNLAGGGALGMAKRLHVLGDPLLRIDAGPPRFDVTVDGQAFESGTRLAAGDDGIVDVRAVISDEVAIEDLTLEIANQDETDQLTVTPLVDQTLDAARQYEVTFTHQVLPSSYNVILRAHQAEDTTGGDFQMVGEFVLEVITDAVLKVDGRLVSDGDPVPPQGSFSFEIVVPVSIDPGVIRVEIDDTPFTPIDVTETSPDDSTSFLVNFSPTLSKGQHKVAMFIANDEFPLQVVVANNPGLKDVVAYPNPFVSDTQFVYSSDVAISSGTVEVFTTTGRRVARMDIPASARGVGQNAVHWNGRTFSGDEIANGLYLFVITVNQDGKKSVHRGKLSRLE